MSKRPGDPGYAGAWCIHYRYNRGVASGSDADTCEAGVRYAEVRSFKTQPCFLVNGESKPDAGPCASIRRPTAEEITLHEEWLEGRTNVLLNVMTAIKPWRDAHKGKSAREVIECPACAGKLHLSIAAYNGHVHGNCETEGCVSWME